MGMVMKVVKEGYELELFQKKILHQIKPIKIDWFTTKILEKDFPLLNLLLI